MKVKSVYLDAIRGLAALIVCVGHWRYLFFLDYPQLTAHRMLWFVPYAICTLGHKCVIVFFVLSGYLVGGSVLRSLARWSWKRYLIQRMVRLYIVLLPALLLGWALDHTALYLHLYPALYAGQASSQIRVSVASDLGLSVFLQNIAYLQTITGPVFGSNTPLWSLANEFWYYLLFPLALLAITRKHRTSLTGRLLMSAAFLAIAVLIGKGILLGFAWWLAGALLAIVVRTIPAPANPRLWERSAQEMARFSYTLYLVHFPMLMFSEGWLGHRENPNDWRHVFFPLASLAATLVIAYGVAWVTEFRTDTAKRVVSGWIDRLAPTRAVAALDEGKTRA